MMARRPTAEDHEMISKQRLRKVNERKNSKHRCVKGKQTVISINDATAVNLTQLGKFTEEGCSENVSLLQNMKSESDWKDKYGSLKDSQFKHKFLQNLEENDNTLPGNTVKYFDKENIQTLPEMDEELFHTFLLKSSQKEYEKLKELRSQLPIWKMKDDILKTIQENQVVVVCGETGCGKTTQVAQYLLDQAIESKKGSAFRAVCTQPRRIAAVSVAQRVADERLEPCGTSSSSVGYQIRLERRCPREMGSILFCTTGILVQLLQSDPLLEQFSHVLVDEIHERDLMTDFILTVVRDLLPRRPNLRIILMSATINSDIFTRYFNNCPVIHIPGRVHEVKVLHLEDVLAQLDFRVRSQKSKRAHRSNGVSDVLTQKLDVEYEHLMTPFIQEMEANRSYPLHVFKSLRRRESEEAPEELIMSLLKHVCSSEPDGAILVFFPGWEQIKRMNKLLLNDRQFSSRKYIIFTLHSMMPTINQRQVFDRPPRGVRKIILSTNIAETSLTIDDVVYVVDCGKEKHSNFDPLKKIHTLSSEWITVANCLQRQGRAGRTRPGICYRLYSRGRESMFQAHPIPEIKRIRLEELILRVKILKLGRVEPFLLRLPEPPEEATVKISLELLHDLGALDLAERLTPLGFHLAQLPTDPRTGKLILLGAIFGCLEPMVSIAAALNFKDPFVMPLHQEDNVRKKKKLLDNQMCSDHLLIAKVVRQFRLAQRESYTAAKDYCRDHFLSTSTMTMITNMVDQLCRELYEGKFLNSPSVGEPHSNVNSENHHLLLALLCAGFLPNIAEVSVGRCKPAKRGSPRKSAPFTVNTAEDGDVLIHPRSVNYDAPFAQSTLLCYYSKIRSTSVYLHDCSVVPPIAVLFFGGEQWQVKHVGEKKSRRSKFTWSPSTMETTKNLNNCWENYLCYRVSNPGPTDWSPDSHDSALLRAIIDFTTADMPTHEAPRSSSERKKTKNLRECYDLVAPEHLVKSRKSLPSLNTKETVNHDLSHADLGALVDQIDSVSITVRDEPITHL